MDYDEPRSDPLALQVNDVIQQRQYANLLQKYEALLRQYNQLAYDMRDPDRLLGQLVKMLNIRSRMQAQQAERIERIEAELQVLKAWKAQATKSTPPEDFSASQDLIEFDEVAVAVVQKHEAVPSTFPKPLVFRPKPSIADSQKTVSAIATPDPTLETRMEACKTSAEGHGYGVEDHVAELY